MDRQRSLYMPGFLALLFSGFLAFLALGLSGTVSFFFFLVAVIFGFFGFSLIRGFELARKIGAVLYYLLLLLLCRMFMLFVLGSDVLKALFLRFNSELNNTTVTKLAELESSGFTFSMISVILFFLVPPILVFRRCSNPNLKKIFASEGKKAWKFEHLSDEALALLCYMIEEFFSFLAVLLQSNEGQERQFFWPMIASISAIVTVYYIWKLRPLSLILHGLTMFFSLILSWTAQQQLVSQTSLEINQFQDISRVLIAYEIKESIALLLIFVLLVYFYFQRVGLANPYSLKDCENNSTD